VVTKNKIVGPIFPEKIEFDGKKYQTKKVNEFFDLICRVDNQFKQKQPDISVKLSTLAPPAGAE